MTYTSVKCLKQLYLDELNVLNLDTSQSLGWFDDSGYQMIQQNTEAGVGHSSLGRQQQDQGDQVTHKGCTEL